MLCLSNKTVHEIIDHAKREFPYEACGIIAGDKDKKITKVYGMTNTDKSSQSFFMDPKEQFQAMKHIRRHGLTMIAIYHSHPETEAFPSSHDVELALYPDVSYIIASLKNKDNPNIRSFIIVEGKIKEEKLHVTDKRH